MLVDTEAVLARLKYRLQQKDSWGRRELLTLIGELEAESLVTEGPTERVLRLFGIDLSQDMIAALDAKDKSPATAVAAGADGNGHVSQPVDHSIE